MAGVASGRDALHRDRRPTKYLRALPEQNRGAGRGFQCGRPPVGNEANRKCVKVGLRFDLLIPVDVTNRKTKLR
jgi:hypothetical protein